MGAMVIFADLMTNLFASFVLILVLVLGMVKSEYSKQVDLLNRQKKQEQQVAQVGLNDLILSVTKDGQFSFSGGSLPVAREVASLAEVTTTLNQLRPSRLELRIDQNVPTGTTQSIFEDCRDLGIQPLWTFSGKGG